MGARKKRPGHHCTSFPIVYLRSNIHSNIVICRNLCTLVCVPQCLDTALQPFTEVAFLKDVGYASASWLITAVVSF